MRKYLFTLFAVLLIALAGCGDSEEETKEISNVDKESDEVVDDETEESETEENETEEVEESSYDQVLIDSDVATVNLEGISKVTDDIFGESHVITVSIENKSDNVIVVQTDNVSVDGLMVTDNVLFSEEVAAGKKANGKIEIQMFDEEELPPLDEELEMLLLVIDEESYDRLIEEKINIAIK